jgi:hypothetical protein
MVGPAETMPSRKRSAATAAAADPPTSSPTTPGRQKRRRTSNAAAQPPEPDPVAAEDSGSDSDVIDLRDPTKLTEQLLQRQQEKAGRIRLGQFQCAICMDHATSLTVTHCGSYSITPFNIPPTSRLTSVKRPPLLRRLPFHCPADPVPEAQVSHLQTKDRVQAARSLQEQYKGLLAS